MKTVKVHVAAGEGMEDARRAVQDVLEMLNRHFRTRGVEFVAAGEGEGDWTIALYWKDFGGMGREEFEKVYEGFKKEKKPVIHVFFKEPDKGISEELKAFKEGFPEKYGDFCSHFETLDALCFQVASQGLLFGGGMARALEALKVEDGEVWLENEPLAKIENLPFARLTAEQKPFANQNAIAEAETAGGEEYADVLEIHRHLAGAHPESSEPDVVATLNNLAVLHSDVQQSNTRGISARSRSSRSATSTSSASTTRSCSRRPPTTSACTATSRPSNEEGAGKAEADGRFDEGTMEHGDVVRLTLCSFCACADAALVAGVIPSVAKTEYSVSSSMRNIRAKRKKNGPAGHGKRETPLTARKTAAIDQVDFSAIAPERLTEGEYSVLQIAMYEKGFRKTVEEMIAAADEPMKEIRGGNVAIPHGAHVKIVLSSPDIDIEDSVEEGEWNGGYRVFSFSVQLPSGFAKTRVLFVATVYVQGGVSTKLKFTVSCRGTGRKVLPIDRNDIHSAFISYASEDLRRVARFVQGVQKARPDMDVFLDVAKLRSGEDWEKRLYEEIGARDILYLCWSRHAMESAWVDREWRYALRTKGIGGIEPVPMEPPNTCPPPAELSRLHFNDWIQYLTHDSAEE